MAGVSPSGLSTIAYASIDAANDTLLVADVSDTVNYVKTFAVEEIVNRTLGGASIAWMPTAFTALGDLASGDYFVAWDATASSWVPLPQNLLTRATLGGTDVSWMTSLTLANVDSSADYMLMWDASANGWRRVLASQITTKLMPVSTINVVSTPRTVLASESGIRLSNYGASTVVEFDLPAAVVGYRYTFARHANYSVQIDPYSSETIAGNAAGKYIDIVSRGEVTIECFQTGTWEVTGSTALYNVEA